MTIEARIPPNIIREARKGVAERKSGEEARERVPQIFEDLRGVYARFLKKNKNEPTRLVRGGIKAMDLHVRDDEIREEAHVSLGSYGGGMLISVDGLPILIRVQSDRIQLSTEQKVTKARSYSDIMHTPMGWPSSEDPPFEIREPSGEEVGFIEELVAALKDPKRTRICPED